MLTSLVARTSGTLFCLSLLLMATVSSLVFGHIPISLDMLVASLMDYDPASLEHLVVRTERFARTITALVVGRVELF